VICLTKKQELIYSIVMNACNHPTAEQIFLEAKRKEPGIAMGTVYRNLGILSDNGQILHIPIIDGPDRYDKTLASHEHMLCISCGQIVDADVGNLTSLLSEKCGLEISSYELNLKGICPECSAKQSPTS